MDARRAERERLELERLERERAELQMRESADRERRNALRKRWLLVLAISAVAIAVAVFMHDPRLYRNIAPPAAPTPLPFTGSTEMKPSQLERETIIVQDPTPKPPLYTCGPGTVWVHGYTRKNGHRVEGYCRSAPSP